MSDGLDAATREKILAIFAAFPAVERVVLYGSRAKGTYKAGSDIDLTLVGDRLTAGLRADIADALDELLLPYCVDISLYAEIENDALRAHIDRVGVVFYERTVVGDATIKSAF